MKKLFVPVLGIMLAAASAPAIAQPAPGAPVTVRVVSATDVNPAALAIAHQILDIGIPVEKRSQMFSSLLDSLNAQVIKSTENLGLTKDKDFQALLTRTQQRMWDQMKPVMSAALPDIFESMARAYAREFSIDDLSALLAFVKTPAGQHFFERAPLILKDPDVQAANQRAMTQFMGKLPEIMRQNKQDIEEYVAKKAKQEKAAAPTPVS